MNELFESKEEIIGLINRADNQKETIRLTEKFRLLKKERKEFYLTLNELEDIFKWKLRKQYGRQEKQRRLNTNDNVISITRTAFGIKHSDVDFENKLRLKLLTSISGIEIPVASAILTLCYPEEYSVIDFRNWNQIFKSKITKTYYTANEYIEYLNVIKSLAEKYSMTTQEIDIAIWQKDIEKI